MHVPVVATSLKIPKALKSRISRLAKREGASAHALMLRMLEERVEDAERFQQFVGEAHESDLQMQRTGKGYAADAVHEYVAQRLAGCKTSRPKPVRWRG
jgi:predicted DNA-binding protein